jgi:tRNA(fMet)-specific endonuclease VapC
LYTWALRASAPPRRLEVLVDLLRDVRVLDVNTEVGRKFGELRATLLDAGKRTPQVDLFIAATALFHGLTLVSHNVQDFADVPDLSVVDWLAA